MSHYNDRSDDAIRKMYAVQSNLQPSNPFQHAMGGYQTATKESRVKELQNVISKNQLELDRLLLDDPHQGPTNRELQKHESLNNAWEAYMIIRKTIGI